MRDVAICGKDIRFCRMLELELCEMGFSVVREPNGGAFRLWLMDLDSVPPTSGHERVYVGFTRDAASVSDEVRGLCRVIFERPVRMQEVRRQIAALLSVEALPRPAHMQLSLDEDGFSQGGERLALTATEETILRALFARRGEVVPRAELCALLGNETNPKLADVYVCLLRRKLEAGGAARLLFTVRGVGYRLEEEK